MGSNNDDVSTAASDVLAIADILELIKRTWLPASLGFLGFSLIAVVISFLVQPKYQSEILLEYIGDPTKQERVRSGAGNLGGLAALAGLSIGSEGNPKDAALALIRSRDFTGDFIEKNKLMPILNAEDWDVASGQWREPSNIPSAWRTVRRFNRDVLYISEDAKTGLVSVIVTWTNPDIAAEWAENIVSEINNRLRELTIQETARSIEHLKVEMAATQNPELQRAIAGLLQAQIEALMFADIRDEFAFRTIDGAHPAPHDEYVYPNHILFALVGGFIGAFLGILFWMFHRWRAQ